ncbi:MAG: hypothetical protein ACI4J6_05115 [Oscillospiraceae bacterium]
MGWKELFYTSVTGKSTVPHRASVSMHVKGEAAAAQICSKDNVMCSADEIELLYLKSRSRFRLYKALYRACLIGCLAFFLFPYILPLMKRLIPSEFVRAGLLLLYFAFLVPGRIWERQMYDYKMRRMMYKTILLEKRKQEYGDDIEGYKRYVDEMGDLLSIDERTVIDPQIEFAFIGVINPSITADKQLEQVRYKLDGQKKVKKISAIAAAVLAVLSSIDFIYYGKANFAVMWGYVFAAAFFIILICMFRSSKKLREREEELECTLEDERS